MHTLIEMLPARELLSKQASPATWNVIDAGGTAVAAIVAHLRTRA